MLSFKIMSEQKENKKKKKKEDETIKKIDSALKKISEGYAELSQIQPIKDYRRKRFVIKSALLVTIISALFIYQQSIMNNAKERTDNIDQTFLFAINSFESNFSAVQSTGLNNLFEVAFTPTLKESNRTAASPIINLYNILLNKQEYKFLDRSRDAFIAFAKTNRGITNTKLDPVSTSIINTALKWQKREDEIFKDSISEDSRWLLHRAYVPNAQATSIDLSSDFLYDIVITNSALNNSRFLNCYLEKSNFSGSNLTSAVFKEANLKSALVKDCLLNFADFTYANCTKTDFSSSTIENANFSNANLRDANFDNSIIRGTNFSNSDLAGASFKNCIFLNVNLENCIMKNADLTNADLSKAKNLNTIIK